MGLNAKNQYLLVDSLSAFFASRDKLKIIFVSNISEFEQLIIHLIDKNQNVLALLLLPHQELFCALYKYINGCSYHICV